MEMKNEVVKNFDNLKIEFVLKLLVYELKGESVKNFHHHKMILL